MRSAWRRAVSGGLVGLVVTTAILVVFSEAFYWYSGGVDYPARLVAYLILGCGLLWSLSTFRVDGWAGVVLAGAIYGFVAEGVLTPVLYGAFPFDPFRLSYTSLAWHAVLSVGFGLVLLHRLLVAGRVVPLLAAVAAFGVLWGLWATSFWLPENINDPEVTGAGWLRGPLPVTGFLLYTSLVTVLLAILHGALGSALRSDALRPGRLLCRLAAIAAVLWFALFALHRVPFALLVLPVLLGVCVLGLRALRPAGGAPSRVLAALGRPVAWPRLLLLVALPIAATAAYATVDRLEPGTETLRRLSGAIVWTQTVLGWLAFLAALLTARGHRGGRLTAVAPERHRVPGAGPSGGHP